MVSVAAAGIVLGGAAGPAPRMPGQNQHPAKIISIITNIGVSRQNLVKIWYLFILAVSSCQVQGDVGSERGRKKTKD
jgi:hypothetical protein